jgi:hypothetical protein
MRRSLVGSLALGVVGTLVACSSPPGSSASERTGQAKQPIINGTQASAYPEAALVDMYQNGQLYAYCSGSLIAPGVVLTAGHCVFQTQSWVVTLPYNGNQQINASNGTTYDWMVMGEQVDPNYHDIGLVFLDQPAQVTPSQCPVLASQELPDNSTIVNIGRIQNGQLSMSDLFVSPTLTVVDGAQAGYPYDYDAQDYIESGDSGGPDEVPNTTPHQIVSVNSGGGSDEVLARTDTIYSWIQQQIQAHGGPCANVADGGSSSSSSGGSSSGSGGSSSGSGGSSSGSGGSSSGSGSNSSSGGSGSGSGGSGSGSGGSGSGSGGNGSGGNGSGGNGSGGSSNGGSGGNGSGGDPDGGSGDDGGNNGTWTVTTQSNGCSAAAAPTSGGDSFALVTIAGVATVIARRRRRAG